jgi:hypothetical protein
VRLLGKSQVRQLGGRLDVSYTKVKTYALSA